MRTRNNIRSFATGFAASLLLMSSSQAAMSILFNSPFVQVSQGFANSSAVVSNGLAYGIVIEASGTDGFGFAQYDGGFDLDRGLLIPLTTGNGTPTNNQLWLDAGVSANDVTTHDTSSLGGGNGGLSGIGGIPSSAANKRFAIIWFDAGQAVGAPVTDGTQFGILTDASFVLPNDGNFGVVYDAPFSDTSAKPADDGEFTVVPEPSASLLALLGLAGLLRRKR